VPAPIGDDERQRIIELLPTGKTCGEIAREVGRSTNTVSRVAATVGHSWGHVNAARAHEATAAYGAERRAVTMQRFHERADELLARMEGRFLVFNFGGKENTYNEHELEQPPVEAIRAMMQSAREAMRTVLDIDRHDNRNDEGLAAVDEWLRGIVGR
jgi:hypothetical protein